MVDRMLRDILTVGGIAGVIAIVITGAICYRYVLSGAEPIPEVLTYSLTTIIGFYFGTHVQRRAKPADDE
jgi:uncharacterized membrane protein YfcA